MMYLVKHGSLPSIKALHLCWCRAFSLYRYQGCSYASNLSKTFVDDIGVEV